MIRPRSPNGSSFLRFLILVCVAGVSIGGTAEAGGKTVHVNEYTKQDGTVVHAHDRKAPGSNPVVDDEAPTYVPQPYVPKTDNFEPVGPIHYRYGRQSTAAASSISEVSLPGLVTMDECPNIARLLTPTGPSPEVISAISSAIQKIRVDSRRRLAESRSRQAKWS